jgi:hypothetical protein
MVSNKDLIESNIKIKIGRTIDIFFDGWYTESHYGQAHGKIERPSGLDGSTVAGPNEHVHHTSCKGDG